VGELFSISLGHISFLASLGVLVYVILALLSIWVVAFNIEFILSFFAVVLVFLFLGKINNIRLRNTTPEIFHPLHSSFHRIHRD